MSEESTKETSIINEVSQVNKATTSGTMGLLLNPAFKVFGKRLGEWAEQVTAKRKENLEKHIDAVKAKNPEKILEATPQNQEDMTFWSAEASKYDENDDRASVWRGIFENLLNDQGAQSRIMKTARQLGKSDLTSILEIHKDRYAIIDKSQIYHLEKIGVIILNKKLKRTIRIYLIALATLLLTYALSQSYFHTFHFGEAQNLILAYMGRAFLIITGVLTFLFVIDDSISNLSIIEITSELSEDGIKILKAYERYKSG